ncbi:MAG: hypothetical protein HXY24_11800, partial [Rubrivivax sp.]|nr:hypothetical protein [Rubrivivax sp.]
RPRRVTSTGQHSGGLVSYISTLYDFGGPTVSCQSGAISMKGRMFCHQYEAYFERATAVHGAATEPAGADPALGQTTSQVLTVYHADGSVSFPKPPGEEAFAAELGHAATCVQSGIPSPIIGAESARDALAVTCLEAQSVLTGQAVDVP